MFGCFNPLAGKRSVETSAIAAVGDSFGVSIPLRGKGQLKRILVGHYRGFNSRFNPLAGKRSVETFGTALTHPGLASFNPLAGKRSVETDTQ